MSGELLLPNRAAELREAFDRSFAQAPTVHARVVESLLAIRIGANPYVLRLTEVSGLFADKKITWLPTPVAELLGIAGFRGTVLPVYDLGMLLGCLTTAAPRWLVVTAGTPVALAFDGFDRYLSVPGEAILPEARAEAHGRHVREIVQTVDFVGPLISLTSILEWVRHRSSRGRSEKER